MAPNVNSSDRRPMGALEAEVLRFLWGADRAVTPGEVRDGTGLDLAYTTVMTILTRLWKKGLVDRERHGRPYAYRPRMDEAEYVARSMREALGHASDRTAVLGRFVGSLSRTDARALRAVLDSRPPS
jgi:predicted transcriptional regulator